MKKTLVLTGCAGFIGINFLKEFISSERNKNYDYIFSVDKMGYATKYTSVEYKMICAEADIITIDSPIAELTKEDFSRVNTVSKFDVLDFASESHVDNSIKNPYALYEENALLTAQLLNILGKENIDTFYHITTDEVYGDIELEHKGDPDLGSFKTNSPYKPSNPYSASKVAQDALLESMSRTFGMDVVLIRMANQFGPYQYVEKMLPISIQRAMAGEKIGIYGDGKNCRQWTFVEDTVRVINDVLVGKLLDASKNFQVVHIADENNLFDNNELVKILIEELRNADIHTEIEYINDRPGHDMMYCLHVEPEVQDYYTTDFRDALRATIKYYLGIFNNE